MPVALVPKMYSTFAALSDSARISAPLPTMFFPSLGIASRASATEVINEFTAT